MLELVLFGDCVRRVEFVFLYILLRVGREVCLLVFECRAHVVFCYLINNIELMRLPSRSYISEWVVYIRTHYFVCAISNTFLPDLVF